MWFCYDTQNSVQFKKYELVFFFWNFPFNSFRLQVTGTVESKSKIKEGQLYIYKFFGNSFHWWVNALHLELGWTSCLCWLGEYSQHDTMQLWRLVHRSSHTFILHTLGAQAPGSEEVPKLSHRKDTCTHVSWQPLLRSWQTGSAIVPHVSSWGYGWPQTQPLRHSCLRSF